MSNLLVTGAAGFIGTNFVHHWLKKYDSDKVIVLDSLTYAGNKENLFSLNDNKNFEFVYGDIRDQELVEKLLKDHNIDTLVNFAAESHVDRSITGPDAFIDTNINGTHSLLKAARAVWLDGPDGTKKENHRFHHVSTDEVYGTLSSTDPAFTEETPYAPNSPYSASKAASDHLVRAYQHTYGLKTSTSNCSNNYGAYHFPEKLFPLCILNILSGKNLPIYGDGQQIRDWLHVDDHCRGIELVLKEGRVGETYNVGGNNEQANLSVVKLLCKIIDELFVENPALKDRFPSAPASQGLPCESLITFVKDRAGHDARYAVDISKIQKELNYQPQVEFEEGLRNTILWYLENEGWWKNILDGSYRQWVEKQYDLR